jgi:hypothetical protein
MFIIFMSPKVDFVLKVYEEYRGSKVPIAHIKNGTGIKLKNEDFSFCKVKVFGRFSEREYWQDLSNEYFVVQGTDLPIYTFQYESGGFKKTVKIYGPPNFPEKIKEVFDGIQGAECANEILPKRIVLSWEKVYVRRIAIRLGEFEGLVGIERVEGKNLDIGYRFFKKYGEYLLRDGIFSDSKGNTYKVRVVDVSF